MFKKEYRSLWVSLIINAAIVVLEIIASIVRFSYSKDSLFVFYTRDSNLILMIASLILMTFEIIKLKKDTVIPRWVYFLKFMAVGLTTITFIVVVFILCPLMFNQYGIKSFYQLLCTRDMLYHHLLCPILAFVSFVFFEKNQKIRIKNCIIALIPTLLYGAIMIVLVLLHKINPPYPFLDVYHQPIYMSIIWIIVIFGASFGIYVLLSFLQSYRRIKSPTRKA